MYVCIYMYMYTYNYALQFVVVLDSLESKVQWVLS